MPCRTPKFKKPKSSKPTLRKSGRPKKVTLVIGGGLAIKKFNDVADAEDYALRHVVPHYHTKDTYILTAGGRRYRVRWGALSRR